MKTLGGVAVLAAGLFVAGCGGTTSESTRATASVATPTTSASTTASPTPTRSFALGTIAGTKAYLQAYRPLVTELLAARSKVTATSTAGAACKRLQTASLAFLEVVPSIGDETGPVVGGLQDVAVKYSGAAAECGTVPAKQLADDLDVGDSILKEVRKTAKKSGITLG